MDTISATKHPQTVGNDPVSADVYISWLRGALEVRPSTSPGMRAALQTANVPTADAEAIVSGVTRWRSIMVAPAGIQKGLSDHAIEGKQTLTSESTPSSRRRIRFWILVVALCVCVASLFWLLWSHRALNQPDAPQRSDTTPLTVPVTHDSPTAPSHVSRKTGAGRERHPPNENRAHVTHGVPVVADVPSAPPTLSTDIRPLQKLHPESCPPGVDRLGCPSATDQTGQNRSTSCPYGYQLRGGTCAEVDVPKHAHFESVGYGWQCDAGYVQDGSTCKTLIVPPHAHLDVSGHGWFCDAGFEPLGGACQ